MAASDKPNDTRRIVDEPLRLIFSQKEQHFIGVNLRSAKRRSGAYILALATAVLVFVFAMQGQPVAVGWGLVALAMMLAFIVCFWNFWAAVIDWVRFASYRRNQEAFLRKYNRG
ncbi:MAG: hypothetical protein QF654_13175 [Alphaproteobacteria bacterium]|jgi:hypothetical protein|nr:hypothetical protein [Alphaproteobacteria bacterium]